MNGLQDRLERFETLAAECDLIGRLATDAKKRELYLRLALHYRELAADMRHVIATKDAAQKLLSPPPRTHVLGLAWP